ncbi:hypothetical protein SKAU_G00212370 [Synaphobranchus kaupii]|uniref:Gypsy retrotransposon integrase-like protein 1 n=1 Tax=Synaphobranchus kaupii TaxID=118154 RepID=A0A9Q1IT15_SYNKA|nr:hypothetical protein SKAU_G00212370 [Synaphobranchus kaupii]
MAAAGVIRLSESSWASPAVLVRKKDCSLRFCVDYRRLNAVTKRDSYPLPRIDDALDSLGGPTWFSSLDLQSGYWQPQKQVHSFLGLAFYYKRFIKGFANLATPLHALTEKAAPFRWSPECQHSFTSLRTALVTAPVLALVDQSKPFILDTDASNIGMGGVLSQLTEDGEKVTAYFSRTLNRAECNYCVTRRELLAVVVGVRHVRSYLQGQEFKIHTDHATLQWLLSSSCHHGKRAEAKEEEKAGGGQETLHQTAAIACAAAVVIEQLQLAQTEDPEVGPVVQWVQEGQRTPTHSLPEYQGIGCAVGPLAGEPGPAVQEVNGPLNGPQEWSGAERVQLVVPHSLQGRVLQMVYGAPTGHLRVNKTLHRLRQQFYWGQCRRDMESYCHRCDACTAKKGLAG